MILSTGGHACLGGVHVERHVCLGACPGGMRGMHTRRPDAMRYGWSMSGF